MCELTQAARLLEIEIEPEMAFMQYRTGFRTRAVLATKKGVTHRFQENHERVVVKLYKGQGNETGSLGFQHYHESDFNEINALTDNDRLQQSVSGGVKEDVGPYAVVQHIEGEELAVRLLRADLTKQEASQILRDIMELIWIPLWHSGLRFKDGHPGNFVLTPDMQTVMIDTEQMRKNASELLREPESWTQRDKHQRTQLSRLPRLMKRVVKAANPSVAEARILREIKASLSDSELADSLALLGRPQGSINAALQAMNALFEDLKKKGLIE